MTDEITDDEAVEAIKYFVSRLKVVCGRKANMLHIDRRWFGLHEMICINNQFGLCALTSVNEYKWLYPKEPKAYLDDIIMTDELRIFLNDGADSITVINPFYGKSYSEIKVMTDFGNI